MLTYCLTYYMLLNIHTHTLYYTGRNLTGTPRYASINNHKGIHI